MSQASMPTNGQAPLTGGTLLLAAIVLAAASFMAILDTTIANVSVPTIAGGLGATVSQGTWVITSYSVAEAITVPLTGWLAARFGPVRLFVGAMVSFGIFSALCGLSNSLGLLVLSRIFQGFAGGPMMPLTQTLLLTIFPKEKAATAIGLGSITAMVGPILGPLLGGYLCEKFSWPWIFYINLPFALIGGFLAWRLLKRYEQAAIRNPIDRVGLTLLVVWVGALQLLLDEGKALDWFSSPLIIILAVVAVVGFAAFMIWEIHDEHPVVDFRVFRHRGFSASVAALSLIFGSYFAATVLTPLWLQTNMNYTSADAGMVMAWSGISGIFAAPLVARLLTRVDARKLVTGGVLWFAAIVWLRSIATTDMDYGQIALLLALTGMGLPFCFISASTLAMGSLDQRDMATGAGLLNFMRTLSAAFSASLTTTLWEDYATMHHAELVGVTDSDGSLHRLLESSGMAADAVQLAIDRLITTQSVMLATNQLMAYFSVAVIVTGGVIWLAPKPSRQQEAGPPKGH